jgi:hypothetical protein
MPPETAPLALAIAPPASAIYVNGEESLRVSVLNALAGVRVRIAGRFLHLDGRIEPIVDTILPTSDRVVSVKTLPLAAGWLMNAQASVNAGAPLTGQTFAILSLVRGRTGAFEELATLAAGPITAVQRLAWPGSLVGNSLDGAGALRTIVGSAPGAGAEISETVPTGARWELLTFDTTLTTSATVANRMPALRFQDGASVLGLFPASTVITASAATGLTWAASAPGVSPLPLIRQSIAIGAGIRLGSGAVIGTTTTALQAGDVYTQPRYLVREWIEGA